MARNEIGCFILKNAVPWAVKRSLRWLEMPEIVVELGGLLAEMALDEDE